jgi:hypothetical protein
MMNRIFVAVLATIALSGCATENTIKSALTGGEAIVSTSNDDLILNDRVGIYQRVCKHKMKSGRSGMSHTKCTDSKIGSGLITRRLSNTEVVIHTDQDVVFTPGLVIKKE